MKDFKIASLVQKLGVPNRILGICDVFPLGIQHQVTQVTPKLLPCAPSHLISGEPFWLPPLCGRWGSSIPPLFPFLRLNCKQGECQPDFTGDREHVRWGRGSQIGSNRVDFRIRLTYGFVSKEPEFQYEITNKEKWLMSETKIINEGTPILFSLYGDFQF